MLTVELFSTVAWWMLDLWFGLDASGFDKASKFSRPSLQQTFHTYALATFHPVFGPVLMVTYACLSNTLLLTSQFISSYKLFEDKNLLPLSLQFLYLYVSFRVIFPMLLSHPVVDTLEYFRLRERGCCCRGTL